jgi:ATP-dependent DNA helicase RecG
VTQSLDQLAHWMNAPEGEHLEFKEAKNHYDFEKLVKYCCALANERGGHIVLGVTDKVPRKVVGTTAFDNLERTKAGLAQRLHLRIDIDELAHPDGRVIVVDVPSRPVGMPIQVEGAYWMRAGEELVPMTPDMLKRIFDEAQPDFSAETCPDATLDDLDPRAVETFRTRWATQSNNAKLAELGVEQLLADAELMLNGKLTHAALVLMGTHRALGRCLAQAEVVFEYRSDEASIGYQQRKEFREGFLLFHDELWSTISLRNDLYSYQEGLFRREILAFNESAVREAVLNAVCHRDYRLAGSVFVKQWPQKIEISSPGGFPPDITPENILVRQSPRNRRIADALARCGLVERSGQGADRMYEAALREGKAPPDFSQSDQYVVQLVLNGQVQDEAFLHFLNRLVQETRRSFGVQDLVVIDAVHRQLPVPTLFRNRLANLLTIGAIERVARNKLVLAKRFYKLTGRPGEYTRRRGLDRDTKKALLLKHIEGTGPIGAPFDELAQVLPEASRNELKVLLRELKTAGQVEAQGATRGARWCLVPARKG